MHSYQKAFIELAIQEEVLTFGEFTLKSGRTSPYFFNAGKFRTGAAMAKLGQFYASALEESGVDYDLIFGPAYKGIPLAATTAVSLFRDHNKDIPFCFNRKEAKNHGEGGVMVGAPLEGKTVIIDDVITAGTAIGEVMDIIEPSAAVPAAVLIGLDRQEKGKGEVSAIQEVEARHNIPVISIIKLADLIAYLNAQGDTERVNAMQAYRDRYGIDS